MKIRVLVLGAGGQLGSALAKHLSQIKDVECLALTRSGNGAYTGDITDSIGIERTIKDFKPQIIFNAAAYTDVRGAQSNPDGADAVNAAGVRNIACCAQTVGALVVHYSTDYVFDGMSKCPYIEDDVTHPVNRYGLSKLKGEKVLQESNCRHLIFRTSWVVSGGKCFLTTILKNARRRTSMQVVSDQVGVPTTADFLAQYSVKAALKTLTDASIASGIYHLVPDGQTDWCSFARWIVAHAPERLKKDFVLKPEGIESITTETYRKLFEDSTDRPKNSLLSTEKYKQTFQPSEPIADWSVYCGKLLDQIAAEDCSASSDIERN